MKVKVLVMLSVFLTLTSLIVCVSVSAYNAWASGSRNADAGTISLTGGANSTGLVSGTVKASVSIGNKSDRDSDTIHPGTVASVSVSMGGPDTSNGSANGYVSGRDVHNWHHRRTHDVRYSAVNRSFTETTTHVITPPEGED